MKRPCHCSASSLANGSIATRVGSHTLFLPWGIQAYTHKDPSLANPGFILSAICWGLFLHTLGKEATIPQEVLTHVELPHEAGHVVVLEVLGEHFLGKLALVKHVEAVPTLSGDTWAFDI